MLDTAIENFFAERKEAWLKKHLKPSMSENEKREKEKECEEVFSLKNWMPDAARRAGQISLATHPCTFSHPSARKNKNGHTSSIIARARPAPDGFLRSGNLQVESDALGNAAALDVYKFLTLVMQDKNPLLVHLQENTELARKLLKKAGSEPESIKAGFLAMVAEKEEAITSSKVKQVYFPVGDHKAAEGYHLLSVLSHSGHMFEMRKRLDELRFSEEVKSARELRKNNQYSETGYQEIYNLTTIGFGGTKPQNISVLNTQNAGRAHLLLSLPPELSSRNVRLPVLSFFEDTVPENSLREIFHAFHRTLVIGYNNIHVREKVRAHIQEYIDLLILKMWQVRKAFDEQPSTRPDTLPEYQKLWLFPEREEEREQSQQWLETLIEEAARYFINSYEKMMNKTAVQLGDAEMEAFMSIIEESREDMS